MTVLSTSTITPLMVAAVPGLMENDGFRVNEGLAAAIHQYGDLTSAGVPVPASGTLISDGNQLILLDTELVTTADGTGNTSVTVQLTQTPYGTLSGFDILWEGSVLTGTLSSIGVKAAYYVGGGYSPPETGVMTWTTTTTPSIDGNTSTTTIMPTVTITSNELVWDGMFTDAYGDMDASVLGESTVPGLTGVFPGSFETSGSLYRWMDFLITRVLGTNKEDEIDMMWFTSLYAQAKGLLAECNPWHNSVKEAESKTLTDFGANSYQDFVGQEFLKYKHGSAITSALTNLGDMIDGLSTGKFGTPGAVAFTLINAGLSQTGNLGRSIIYGNINSEDLTNPMYEPAITAILSNITDPKDLKTIQSTMKSNVPDMVSPMDYTLIANCAGRANDSLFANFVEVGQDLNSKSQYLGTDTGANVVALISSMNMTNRPGVEQLAQGSLVPGSMTNVIRNLIPVTENDERATLYDIIGFVSGYCKEDLIGVNNAVDQVAKSEYGPQIMDAFRRLLSTSGTVIVHGAAGNMTYEATPSMSLNAAIEAYEDLVTAMRDDPRPEIQAFVKPLMTKYEHIALRIELELKNYPLGDFQRPSYTNPRGYFGFTTGLHDDALDAQEIHTFDYLSALADKSVTGQAILSILDEGKNIDTAQQYLIEPKGYIG